MAILRSTRSYPPPKKLRGIRGKTAAKAAAQEADAKASAHESDADAQETTHRVGSQAHPIIIPDDETTRRPSNKRKRTIAWEDPGFQAMWQEARIQWPKIAAEWLASNDPELNAAAAFGQVVAEIEERAASQLNEAWKETERRLNGKRIILKFRRILEELERYSKRRR